MSEAVDVLTRLSETFDPGGACHWEGEDGEWLRAHSAAIDAVGRVYEALRAENARLAAEVAQLTAEIRVLVETSDMPCRQMRLTARMDRVEWTKGEWSLHFSQSRSIHQGNYILWEGDKCRASGTRAWCERRYEELAEPCTPGGDQ